MPSQGIAFIHLKCYRTGIIPSKENVTEGTMSITEEMSIDERRKYLHKMRIRYWKAKNKKEKSQLLDEMEAVIGLHRKSVIRLINSELARKPRRRQRGRKYGLEVEQALRVIDESFDGGCAERLTPNLVWMAKHLAAHDELEITDELLEKLGIISISTTGRILGRIRQDQPRLRRKRPKRSTRLQRDIPAGRIAWDEQEPGHFEVDLVHHCGPDASGHFVHSLQMVDVATLWSERVAMLGRSHLVMKDGFCRIAVRLPIPVKELHPDNGSEFLNDLMLDFWEASFEGVELSRSRPYKKNDNRYVEQRNLTLVRNYLGYERFDTVAHTLALNQLYDKLWLYDNFFQPVMHLAEKTVIPSSNGSRPKTKRRYDQAQTPFDRLCATGILSQVQQDHFETLRVRTNPRQFGCVVDRAARFFQIGLSKGYSGLKPPDK